MFKTGDPDTASRPAIITMPGQGELGVDDLSKLEVFGPHFWLKNGWDGGVTLGNGKHYPILITVCYVNNKYPTAPAYYNLLSYLLKTYHIKRNSVHLAGLSQGAFTSGALIMYEQTAGDETGMKMVTTLTALEGTPDPLPSPFSTWSRGFTAYKVWAKKYGGRYFYLEGSGTDNFRDGWHYADAMNDSVPGSAYFSYEGIGGGAHCCWNSMYDPNATNWTCAPATALGPNNAPSQAGTNQMGDYKASASIFQWMMKHGDTTLVGSTATAAPAPAPAPVPPPTVSAGSAQTITLPTNSVTLTGTASETNGTIAAYVWSQASGPSTATIGTATKAQTTVSGLVAGTYVFQLQATDGLGNKATATVQVTVNPAPAPAPAPVAPTTSSLPANVMKQVVVAEYRTWYITQDGKVWAYNNNSPLPVQFPIGGLKADTGAGGFNYFRILDEKGYVWTSKIDYTTNTTRIDTDTTGAAFGGSWYIDAYGHVGLTIRADSSVWYFGQDAYALFYTNGSLATMTGTNMKPTQLSPAGMKFKKVLFGGDGILGLTTSGQVYKWSYKGSRIPTLISTVRPAIDIFTSHLSANGCIIPDAGGNANMGYPYIWGTASTMWGGVNATTPTSVKALWKMTAPIKEISMDWNTIHFIDSLGNMYGCGYNSSGEVGNGEEFVGKYNYPGWPNYGWSFTDYENPTGIPVQIGKGTKWKHIYSNNWFGFYKYAMDANDSIYSWGRNKSLTLGNGLWNGYDGGQYHPNTLDVLKPTMVHPLTSVFTEYGYVPPTITVDAKRSIATSTATLTGKAKALSCVAVKKPAANGKDTVGYGIVSYQWTKVSGPAGGTITAPNAASTAVTGLTTGTYIFNLIATDDNTGTLSANDTIVVNAAPVPAPPVANAGNDQTIILPIASVTLSGSATGTSIKSYAWSQVSGPSTAIIATLAQAQTGISTLIAGTYIFQLKVTDSIGRTAYDSVNVIVNPALAVIVAPAPAPAPAPTPTVSYQNIPGTVQAETYSQMTGVTVETTTDAGGGQDASLIDAGDQISYNVNAAFSGAYSVNLRVATPYTGASFKLTNAAGYVLATVTVPFTGGWQKWSTLNININIPAGQQTLKIVSQNNFGFNLNWMQFSFLTATTVNDIPGTVQAEEYDNMIGVALETTTDSGGGKDAGVDGSDQMSYRVNVNASGAYTVGFRVASPYTGASFKLMDGKGNTLATIAVPNTGGWQTWKTVSATVNLTAGSQQTLVIVSQNVYPWNFNWMQFARQTTTTASSTEATASTNMIAAGTQTLSSGSEAAHFSLYPNPAIDQVTIDIANSFMGRLDVQVISVSGIVVRNYQLNKQMPAVQAPISLNGLARGMYIVRVQGLGWSMTEKVVKQ